MGQGKSSKQIKPVHEVRIGRIKTAIWANDTQAGVRHNITVRRIFKRDESAKWEDSDSFSRDELPIVIEVCRAAWVWILSSTQTPKTNS